MHFGRICAAVRFRRSLCEQQILKLDIAVTKAHCQAVVCTAALVSEGYTLADLCCSALSPVIVRAANSQSRQCSEKAHCQAVVCTAAPVSEVCTLAGSVLQCTDADHCGGSKVSNSTLQ